MGKTTKEKQEIIFWNILKYFNCNKVSGAVAQFGQCVDLRNPYSSGSAGSNPVRAG